MRPKASELYVIWGSAFPFEAAVLPFATSDPFPQFRPLAVGIAAHEPHFLERLKEYQIADIYRALYLDPRVYLMASSPEKIIMLQRYLAEHYGVRVSPSVRFVGRTFSIYRFVPVD